MEPLPYDDEPIGTEEKQPEPETAPVVQPDGDVKEVDLYREATEAAIKGELASLGGPLVGKEIKRYVADKLAKQQGKI